MFVFRDRFSPGEEVNMRFSGLDFLFSNCIRTLPSSSKLCYCYFLQCVAGLMKQGVELCNTSVGALNAIDPWSSN